MALRWWSHNLTFHPSFTVTVRYTLCPSTAHRMQTNFYVALDPQILQHPSQHPVPSRDRSDSGQCNEANDIDTRTTVLISSCSGVDAAIPGLR